MIKSIKTTVSVILSVFIVFASVACGTASSQINSSAASYIDNSSLMTKYVPDDQVELDADGWPLWAEDLMIAECRIETAAPDRTVRTMSTVFQHYAEMGVNGLWITPVEDKGLDTVASTYCAYGPHTVNPYITGQIEYGQPWRETDYDEGRRILKKMVDEAHSYNIRVFFDKVPWGVSKVSPLITEHPNWFKSGTSTWGGVDYYINNIEVQEFYMNENIKFIKETGCDGIRWDLEPNYFGYEFIEDMHFRLNDMGIKPLFWSEDQCFNGKAYAFSQCYGVNGKGVSSQFWTDCFFNDIDIVKAITTGKEIGHRLQRATGESGQSKYYTYQVSSHDCISYHQASPAAWAYQFLYGSFIPIFYIGEEWNAYREPSSLYAATVNFNILNNPDNRAYYEMVKELIKYKWQYKHIINSWAENHRETNICTVKVTGTEIIQGYARYKGKEGFIVIPNVNEKSDAAAKMTVAVPIKGMGLDNYETYTITNVRTGKVMAQGPASKVSSFTDTIEHNTCGLYLITASSATVSSSSSNSSKTSSAKGTSSGKKGTSSFYSKDDNDEDDTSSVEEDDADVSSKKTSSTKQVINRNDDKNDGKFPLWGIILIAVGGVVIIGGGATFLILRKRN